ncbi:DUF1997 domain-containing protein [Stenomitos frigidus]|uniref:DUF1997 domain-containing protein n=1 Tax=Stenomitos frigidus ULC18 TaxID=2107698 RepID=A0A2T1E253_9CYAN|nr:DUF1997 domain-containing protein [Stenomitos frigidus]PSB26836.1 hypothetical protein C7B82_18460 [Stenomitos frigidus ULC18]
MYTRFTAFQAVEMVASEQPVPIQHYLRQPQRVVSALAASSQIEQLESERFRLKMRPLTFMALTVQPIVDLRVWAESDGTVHVQSIGCEIRGVEYINQRFKLNLTGTLQPIQSGGVTVLTGKADLEVQVDVPMPLALTPRPFLEATGNGLLKSVLLTVKQRLMHHLLADYRAWAVSKPIVAAVATDQILPQSPTA